MVDWPCLDEFKDTFFLPFSADQAEISRAPVRLSGHQLAGFQGISWQTCGPWGPNTMSTSMSVAGQ